MKVKAITDLVAAIAISLWLATQTAHAQMIGEVGVLKGAQGAGSVPVFTDRKAIGAFYEANIRNDKEGTEELFNAGRLLMVDVGTKVRVLNGGGFTGPAEVRIQEGEFSSRRVFVSRQWIGPTASNTAQSRTSAGTSSETTGYDMDEEKRKLEKLQEEYKQLTKDDKKEAHKAAKERNESLGVTPTPTPKPKHKRDSRKQQTGPAGEPIYPSRPLSSAKSTKRTSSDWGMTWALRNGGYEQIPVYYGVYRHREQIGLEQERQGEDNITSEQRELWRRNG
jgi:hypothetical protein